LSLVVLGLVVSGCGGGGSQGKEKQGPEAVAAGEFVGEAPDADAFVALIAEEPQEGQDAREVRAYLCDDAGTRSINEWFEGAASGDDLELTSGGGAQIVANLAREGSTGTITLADGRSFSFEASPAVGIGGYYPVSITSDGQASATSWRGTRLEGQRADEPQEEDGNYLISGTLTTSEGEQGAFEAEVAGTEATEGRFIVLNDGRLKGDRKGPGFIDQESDL
jgi:hypothetical protein